MSWIKRNLFFVLSMAAGVILAGFCAFLLTRDLSANSALNDDFQNYLGQYNALRDAPNYPSDDNIKRANQDQQSAVAFLGDFRKVFTPFPAVPNINTDEAFHSYLDAKISELNLGATNARVGVPPEFAFAFTGQHVTLNYTNADIHPMVQQLTEIKAICDILFSAKINFLEALQRSHVSDTDTSPNGSDYIEARTTTNASQTEIITPYKLTFRCFTPQLADVLIGLARASNCFIVKNIDVSPSTEVPPPPVASMPAPPSFAPLAMAEQPSRGFNPRDPNNRPSSRAHEQPPPANVPRPQSLPNSSGPLPAISEHLLHITLSLDVVKVKTADH